MTIRVIDFETTGTEPPAEVCEWGYVDVNLFGVSSPQSSLCGVKAIPPEVRAVHHISIKDCDGFPKFNQEVLRDDEISAYAAHNAEFELKFFRPDKPMICTYKCALRAYPNAPAHNNGALRYWLEDLGLILPIHPKTLPAHRAGPDAYVTGWILLSMLDGGVSVEDMIAWSLEPKVLPTCPIGKFRGHKWEDVEIGFLQWMTNQASMEHDLKWNAQREISRRKK